MGAAYLSALSVTRTLASNSEYCVVHHIININRLHRDNCLRMKMAVLT